MYFGYTTLAVAIGTLLDLIIGDPHNIWHPVMGIGKLVRVLENKIRKQADGSESKLKVGGILLWFLVIAVLLMIYRIGIDAFWSSSSREIFRQFYTLSRDEQLNICLEFFGRRNWVWFGCFGFIGLLGYILSYIKLKTLKY